MKAFSKFVYPLEHLHVPQGVHVPPFENHCIRTYLKTFKAMNDLSNVGINLWQFV